MARILTAVLFAAIGIFLAGGGIWLVALGGSLFYLLAGVAYLATAGLVLFRRPASLELFGLFTLAALGWAVWESGFDWWALAPRGGIIILSGLWLLTPWVRRSLDDDPEHTSAPAWPVAVPVAIAVGVAVFAMVNDPHDLPGQLPTDVAQASPDLGNDMPAGDWHQYGRSQYGQRYSPLDQITPENVSSLEVAWQYQTGDVKQEGDTKETTYQVTPLKIDDTIYLCTPHNWAIALDATSGEQKWKYDPNVGFNTDRQHQTCRGVTYWEDPSIAAGERCHSRVYLPTSDARLIALNADDGTVCESFAENGTLHLEQHMEYNPAGYYYSTSPPMAIDGKIIIGGAVNDNYSLYEPSGVIRGFDAQTGELLWNWDSAKPTQTEPLAEGETYTTNSPNSWSVFSADENLGLVYIPMGNQPPDQLGMNRSEAVETYSSSLTALDINTGQVRWVKQFVHHDLWDMDVPAQPVLLDLQRDGTTIPAVVQATKQGDIYVLNRETGEPIIPITEEKVGSTETIPEDTAAPTQPTSGISFKPEPLTGADMWGATLFDQLACRIKFHSYKYAGRYTPPSLQGSIVYPGNFGTFNWGSVAVDPKRQVMFAMPVYLAFTSRLVPADKIPAKDAKATASEVGLNRNDGADYGVDMGPLYSPLGIPCQEPPWGYVAGVDLTTGETMWQHKNGTVEDLAPLPVPIKLGVPGIGGPMITGGGVAFMGAAVDNYLRAYDLTTGDVLWKARLPAGGQATPMSYEQDGAQYVVMVAGGHGSVGTKPGDYVIAYKLASK
ncbi:glucose/quinate/shikimate family membrane-bound PQQ-dependent dehydrogenase [Roseibium sp. CAU 1637]|uniref:Glucose/quinate/shikimate family membrane-bound PQQ-dependent dehydrogenase n=1 Tax=Roseibium limicola TaxID=2816037 RepID=A0A939J4V4_9HYPH|nr:glucose/quinate/shikimate family membrane-bound PQQ-dependent dehydrogenase [Roseibium limicola]MBO0345155.1 glucose/quinate/shikimate family membrane-bound PQQ-dependent dehydrogenase [Roseibium limicola]